MPELPEVETVKNGLIAMLPEASLITEVLTSKKQLRFKYPRGFKSKLCNLSIKTIHRRAKYLIFDFGELLLISHLGMTGTWRKESLEYQRKNHDHLMLNINDQFYLVYNDPRRFGYIDVLGAEAYLHSRWFKNLGPEPLSEEFSSEYIKSKLRGRKVPVKTAIMDQGLVVGVGNIYASESLFLAGVRPSRRAEKVTVKESEKISRAIKEVIENAIQAGGTTISDFRQAGGSKGYFQQQLNVYGRAGKPCIKCKTKIKLIKQSGRSGFYCPKCQN